jgi:hypothetical protein
MTTPPRKTNTLIFLVKTLFWVVWCIGAAYAALILLLSVAFRGYGSESEWEIFAWVWLGVGVLLMFWGRRSRQSGAPAKAKPLKPLKFEDWEL